MGLPGIPRAILETIDNKMFIPVFWEIVLNTTDKGVYPHFIRRVFVMVVVSMAILQPCKLMVLTMYGPASGLKDQTSELHTISLKMQLKCIK